MFSSADKTVKSAPAVQQKTAVNTFFRKAGDDSFFDAKETPAFFGKPVQAKLTVSTPDDPHEKEADAVAEKVMKMQEPIFASPEASKEEALQLKEQEEIQTKEDIPIINGIQCKENFEQTLQAKSAGCNCGANEHTEIHTKSGGDENIIDNTHGISLHPSDVIRRSGRGPPATAEPFEQTLASSKGSGSALPRDTRQFMESRFNADFGGVRIHTGSQAEHLSSSVNAQAFAHGNDIYFNKGKFSPHTSEGGTLLAHELTHTIQQGSSKSNTSSVQNKASASRLKNLQCYSNSNILSSSHTPVAYLKAFTDKTNVKQIIPNKEDAGKNEPKYRTPDKVEPNAELSNLHVDARGNLHQSNDVALPRTTDNKRLQKKNKRDREIKLSAGEQGDVQVKSLVSGAAPPGNPGETNSYGLIGKIQKSEVAVGNTDFINSQVPSLKIQRKQSSSVMESDVAYKSVINKVKSTSQQAKKHDPSAKKAKEAQDAAKPPANEKTSKAKDNQVAAMAQQAPGTFDKEKFKAALKAKIAALQLNSLQEAEDFKKNNGAGAVKGDMDAQVSSEKDKAAGGIKDKVNQEPSTGNVPGKVVGPQPAVAGGVVVPAISGAQAAPKPVPAEDVSMQKGSQELDTQMADAKVTDKQLTKSNEPNFNNAVTSKNAAQKDAAEAPKKFRTDEKGIISQSQAAAVGVSKTQLGAIVGTRKSQMGGVLSKQQEAKAKDEQARAKVAADIELKFNATKTDVEAILAQLDKDSASMFDKGIEDATKQFEDYVDQEVHNFKIDRYLNHIGGSLLWAKDLLLGPPDEINEIYKNGKARYIQAMDVVINNVAGLVVKQLNASKKRISAGKQEIKDYVDKLPKDLKSVGNEAAKNIQSKFGELESSVNNKQNELVDSLAAKYKAGLDNVDKKIADMKEANKGLIDKAKDFISDVINTIIELKNLILNVLAKAAAAIDLIIDDPIGFLGNLVAGVKQGVMNFMGKIGQYLKEGLMGWLFGTLAQAGIEMPKSFDMQGILSLILQVLGLTYTNIRARAVNIVGEKVVSGLEKAAEIFIIIKNEGIGGLWKFIKDKVEQLKDTVIESIKTFVVEKIVVAGITWLIGLLNPASAFVKACKMIYDVIMFFVTRGKQIMDLVNAVIDSVTEIAKGNIGVAATAVENALAKALPVAISFLASLLGLDGISDKIKEIIAKIQAPINAAIDWVINKAVAMVKGVAGLFSGGKDKDKDKAEEHSPEKQAKIDAGLITMHQEQSKYLKDGKITKADAEKVAATVKANHPVFSTFIIKEVGKKVDFIYTSSDPKIADEKEEVEEALLEPNVKPQTQIKAKYKSGDFVAIVEFVDNEKKMIKYSFIDMNLTHTTTFDQFKKVFIEVYVADKRKMYMGPTPGKRSDVGKKVIARMRSEGSVEGKEPNEQVLHNRSWYHINDCDMSHIIGAAEYWNDKGKDYGPRSDEIKAFMNNDRNYILEPLGPNRSRGHKEPRYLPPTNK